MIYLSKSPRKDEKRQMTTMALSCVAIDLCAKIRIKL